MSALPVTKITIITARSGRARTPTAMSTTPPVKVLQRARQPGDVANQITVRAMGEHDGTYDQLHHVDGGVARTNHWSWAITASPCCRDAPARSPH